MEDAILKVEKNIWESLEDENRIGLLTGLSGMAFFYSKMHSVYKRDEYLIKLATIVEKVNDMLENEPSITTLCSGLAGFGLVLLSLEDDIIDIDAEYFESIDSVLLEDLKSCCEANHYDFLHGSMGIAMYFIERCKSDKNEKNIAALNHFSENLIYKINNSLEEILISEVALDNDDRFCIYFGIAHGIAGYLNFLLYLQSNFSELKTDITSSLQKCISYLKSYKKFDENSKQFYPNLLLIHSNTIVNSRLSWCQGDFGIANSLYNCGIYLNDDHLIKESEELIASCQKISLQESFVNDFGLCHGSAGIAIQYHLASKKHKTAFTEDIQKWMNIVKMQTSDYQQFVAYEKGSYHAETNLLEGSVGLGLILLTLENKIDHRWLELVNLH